MPRRRDQVTRRFPLLSAVFLLALALTPVGIAAGAGSGTVFVPAGGASAGDLATIGPTLEGRLQAVIDQARPGKGVPGISAAVATPDDMWLGVTGKQRLQLRPSGDPPERMRTDTPFSIGSVTKTFVAAVILELVQEGKLKLSDRLSRWETHVPYASRITIRQLLSHTSGVRDMWWNPRYHRLVEGRPTHVWSYAQVRALIGPARFRPGTAFEYSNSNFVLLGRIITLVTHHTVAQEIRTRLLEPLHLDSTWYQGFETGPRTAAMGYQRVNGRWVPQGNGRGLRPTTSIASFFGAAGAMVSTPHDLAIWARALYGGHVLSASSLRQMTKFNGHDYGLGTRRKMMGGRVAWGHGGSLDGFETSMWYVPSLDTAVIIEWNRRELDTDPIASKLATRVVDALDPDVTPPSLGAPRVVLHTGATVAPGYVPVVVSWSPGHDRQGFVSRYQVRRRSGTGPWQSVGLASPRTLRVALSLRADRAAVVAIRAIDDRGNASDWVEARPVIPRWVDESASAVRAGQGWVLRNGSDALGGQVLSSHTAGSRLTFRARAVAIGVVGPRSRVLSRSWVRVDDRPGVVVSAAATRRQPRQTLMSRHWTGMADHTFRITVKAVAHPRVEIDGFVLLETAPAPP